jgi:hypothetical protein
LTNNETLKNWGLVIALLLVSAVATILWQSFTAPAVADHAVAAPAPEPAPLEIRLDYYVLGEQLKTITQLSQYEGYSPNPVAALLVFTGLTLVPILVIAAALAGIFIMLDRQTNRVKQSPEFQTAAAQLNQREQAAVKAERQVKPAKPRRPDPTMPRWAVISTSLIVVLFTMFIGYMMGLLFLPHDTMMGGSIVYPASLMMWGTGLITAVIMFLVLRGREQALVASDDAEIKPAPWAWIWVIITGLLIVGLGTGLSILFRTPAG